MKISNAILQMYGLYANENEVKANAKVRILSNGSVKVTAFNRPVYKREGFERVEFYSRYEEEKNSLTPEQAERLRKLAEFEPLSAEEGVTRSDNLKRAKDKVFEIASANKWDYMITLTLDSAKIDRYSKEDVQALVCKWLDNQVQRKKLCYLLVPEYHQDGAIHFHGLINNALDVVHSGTYKIKGKKRPVMLSTLKKYGFKVGDENVKDVYNLKSFPYGFSTALPLDDNVTAVSLYMTKYITKDLQKIFGSFYMAGGKIKRSLPFELHNIDINDLDKIAGCKVVNLPDNLGTVRYLYTTLEELKSKCVFYG